jgi:lipopolysaccharide/colanic/teichoic acid biosynthesis glycosyltransferase
MPETLWQPSSDTLRIRSILYLVVLDCAVILGCFSAVALARGMLFQSNWILFASVLVPLHVIVGISTDGYAASIRSEPFRAIRKGEQALMIALATVTLVSFFLKTSQVFPRLTIAIAASCAIFLLAISRYFYAAHLPRIIGGNPFSAMLIHDGDALIPAGEFSVVVAAGSYFNPDSHDPMMYDRLAKSLSMVDRVVITCPPERRTAWAAALRGANVQGEIFMPELAEFAPLGMGPDRGAPAIIVAAGPLDLFDRFVKRVFDTVLALVAVILVSPILVGIAIAIRLDSPGPVLFRQTRIGRGNAMFIMLKFRSMYDKELDGSGHRSTARDDDRVTATGRFIRRTSIDELPQLINVLRGDMSIVGPRPHALGSRAADKLFWEVDGRYWDRHATKPGLTGLAQIRGFRGATLIEDDLRNRLQADLEYLENWSIWRDIKIIVLTARVILHRNAF